MRTCRCTNAGIEGSTTTILFQNIMTLQAEEGCFGINSL